MPPPRAVPSWPATLSQRDSDWRDVRPGSHRIGIEGGISSTGNRTVQSATWDGDTLVITNEKWAEPRIGKRESFEQHREVWALERCSSPLARFLRRDSAHPP